MKTTCRHCLDRNKIGILCTTCGAHGGDPPETVCRGCGHEGMVWSSWTRRWKCTYCGSTYCDERVDWELSSGLSALTEAVGDDDVG